MYGKLLIYNQFTAQVRIVHQLTKENTGLLNYKHNITIM